jgi:hypothetical protein
MKATKIFAGRLACQCLLALTATYALAQASDSVADPALVLTPKGKHGFSDYLPYILFGLVALVLAYIAYRYFTDHSPEPDDEINPQ